jgi:hypothetical protein
MLDYIKLVLLLVTCFVIIFTLIKLKSKEIKRDEWKFLLSSFFLTLLLVLIIEIKPHHIIRTKLGASNLITYLFYFVLVTTYFLKYIKIIFRFKYLLIIFSYAFFGLANAIDLLSDGKLIVFDYSEIVEDIINILGIAFWLFFFIHCSAKFKTKI